MNIKRLLLILLLVIFGGLLVWKFAPLALRKPPVPQAAAPGPHVPPGAVLVNINMVGFDPETIDAKVGQPLKLAFFRPNANNCAREVVFPDLGIEKKLPPGETVVVEITPQKTGPLVFECGMKMLKGQLIVR